VADDAQAWTYTVTAWHEPPFILFALLGSSSGSTRAPSTKLEAQIIFLG